MSGGGKGKAGAGFAQRKVDLANGLVDSKNSQESQLWYAGVANHEHIAAHTVNQIDA